MGLDPLTPEVSIRICNHMNKDHKEAVMAYAKYYGKIKSAKEVKMLSITPKVMELEVDTTAISIPFDHVLTDSEDAHKTLVSMLKQAQA